MEGCDVATRFVAGLIAFSCAIGTGLAESQVANPSPVKALGSRLEVLWDMDRIARLDNARLVLHPPELREVAVVHDRPWEGNTCCYHIIFKDGPLYRMYYRGANWNKKATHPEVTCYAESDDGIVWRKPELGLVEFDGSTANNIVWNGFGSHNFTPFRDANPACPADQKYKALGGNEKGLIAFVSPDGLRWRKLRPEPVITKGKFDSQNLAFWDTVRRCYADYHRDFANGVRGIMTCTSSDFVTWTEPQWLVFEEGTPAEHLYTNAIQPYPRVPDVYVGFPKRYLPGRTTPYDTSGAGGLSDGVFMTSRDGLHFKRWAEAFLRPGLQHERWINRNNMVAWGMVETPSTLPGTPLEWSLYSTENYYATTPARLRRMTVRLDGFVSVNAGMNGGSVITKPLTFTAGASETRLLVNLSTSAAGQLRCEVRGEGGHPVPGFALGDCLPLYGDGIELPITWKAGSDLTALAGRTVSLVFELKDADLFAYRFGKDNI